MAFSHTVGGTTFTEASFEGNAYSDESTGFPKALEKMVEHVANAYRGTSTTSNAVGTGSKTWTVTNANSQIPAFAVGMPVRVSRTSAPTTTYMQGEINAFTASTGSTTVNVSSSLGSGTHTDWTITIGGHQTTASASPLGVAEGGTGAGTHTANNVLVGAGTSAVSSVAPGSSGNVLTSNGSTWSSTAAGHVDLVAIADGSEGSPSLANSGDTNTGLYFPAADTVGVVTGGTEQFRFGSNPIPGGSKNMLLNGGMTVAQRGTVTGLGATNYVYFLDGWCHYAGYGSAIRYTASQDNSAGTTSDSGWSLKIDITTADTASTGNLLSAFIQKMEGQNAQHLQYGSANAKATTLSFWVKSPKSGTHCVALYANDGNRSCPIEYTVASADTWEKISAIFPGDTGATVPPNDNTPYLVLVFPLHSGSTYEGTAGSWQSGEKYATSSTVNIGDNTANNFYLTDVQLEVGSVATSYAHEDVGTTLNKCQRYYHAIDITSGTRFGCGGYDGTNALGTYVSHPTEMRAAPTYAFTSSVFRVAHDGAVHDSTITMGGAADQWGWLPQISVHAASTQGEWYWLMDNSGAAAPGSGAITFTAEL